MTGHVSVDAELCIGSSDCVRLLPHAFRIDESIGVSVPLPGAGAADPVLLLRARRNCPTHAIELTDANGDPVADAEDAR
jgi:ferredoxin